MATEIDKRVVQMQFDNKDFEKNCQASLTTLEKLKMALNFDGAKGLDSMAKAANKIDLSNLSKGAEAVEVKFNAMNVAGMTAISELTKGVIGLGKKLWDMSFGLMKTGGMARTLKIEQARFQMAALAKNMKNITNDAEQQAALVERMVNAASEAVSGTAYGMDAAAAVTSQLMASGVMSSEVMLDHLKGIAGAAAMTGRSFEDIGNIFTTVASNGRLMTMQLRQFSAAGLNLSATLGQSLGKSEDEINEMVRKGQISFEQFSKALSDAFGDAASKADDTFSGVTTNIQAQIKRIGQIFTDPFVEHVVPFLKEVKAAIKRVKEVMDPLGKTFEMVFSKTMKDASKSLKEFNVTRIGGIVHGLENIFVSLVLIVKTLKEAFKELFPSKTADQLTDAAVQFEFFTRQLIPSKETLAGLKEILILLLSPLRMLFNLMVSLWRNAAKPLLLVITKLLGSFIKMAAALRPFTKKLAESLTSFEFLDSVLKILTATLSVVVSWLADFVTAFANLIIEISKSDVLTKIVETLQAIGSAIANVILFGLLKLYEVIKLIFSYLNIENLKSVIESIGIALAVVVGVIEQGMLTVLNIIEGMAQSSSVFKSIWEFLKEIGSTIKAFFTGEDTEKHLENIKNKLYEVGEQLKMFAKQIADTMREIGAGKLIVMAFAVGLIFLVFSLVGLVDQTTKLTRSVTGVVGTFTGIKRALGTIATYNGVTQVLIGMAIAIGAVASALNTIGSMKEEELKRSATVLGIFVGAIMGFAIAVMVLQKTLDIGSGKAALGVLTYITGLAIAIFALASAVKIISTTVLEIDQAITVFATLSGLMLTLAGVSILMSRFAKEIKIGALSIIAYALAMKIIVSALSQMRNLQLENVKKTLISFISLMLSFGASMGLASMGGLGVGSFLGFIGAALSLVVLVKVIKVLSEFPYDEMFRGLTNMALIFSPLIAFMMMAAVTNKLAVGSSNILKDLGGLVASFGLLMAVVGGLVAIISIMDTASLARGTIVFMIIGEVLKNLIDSIMLPLSGGNLSNNHINIAGGSLKSIKGILLGLTAILLTLTVFVKAMGTPEALKGIIPSLIMLEVIFTDIAVLVGILSKSTEGAGTLKSGPILASIVGLLSIISAITIVAALLKPDDISKLAIVSAAITILMLGLSVLMLAINKGNKSINSIHVVRPDVTAEKILGVSLAVVMILGAVSALIMASRDLAATPGGINALSPVLIAGGVLFGMITLFLVAANRASNAYWGLNMQAFSTLLWGIASVILALAGSIAIITKASNGIDPSDLTWIMTVLTGAIIAIIFIAGKIVQKLETVMYYSVTLEKAAAIFGTVVLAFVAISLALTYCVKQLSSVPWQQIAAIGLLMASPLVILFAGLSALLYLAQGINYETFASEMKAIGLAILASAAAFGIIAAALVLIIKYTSENINEKNIGFVTSIWIFVFVTLGAMFAALVGFMALTKNLFVIATDMVILAAALVIASTSILVIATAISEMAAISNSVTNPGSLIAMLVATGAITVVLLGTMLLMVKMSRGTSFSHWKEYLSIGAAILAASSVILIIAKAIQMISKSVRVGNFEQVKEAMGMIGLVLLGFTIVMAEIGYLASKISGLNLIAIATAFPIMASSLIIVAEAMQMLAETTRSLQPHELVQLAAIIGGMVLVFTALSTIGVIFATIAPNIGVGIMKVVTAFAIFELAVLAFAASTKLMVDSIIELNSTNIDADKLANNATNSIKGIAQAIRNCAPEILAAVSIIIVGIMAILGAQQVRMALQAVAFVTSFIIGLAAAMPLILSALDVMFDEILKKFDDPAMSEKWENAGKTIGGLIVHGIVGAFLGIAETIANAIVDEINDKFGGFEGLRDKVIQFTMDRNGMGDIYEDIRSGEEYISERNRKNTNRDAELENIQELEKIAGKKLIGYDKVAASKTAEDWMEIVDYINEIQKSAKDAEYELSEDWYNTIDKLRIPPEYVKRIEGDRANLMNAVTPTDEEVEKVDVQLDTLYGSGMQQEIQTITKDVEDVNDAVKETGENAQEASTEVKDYGESTNDVLSKIAEGAKTNGSNIGNNLLNGFNTFFGKDGFIGKALGDFDLTNGMKVDLSSIGSDMGSIIGANASEEIDKDMKSTLEYWRQQGLTSAGYSGKKLWQTSFKDDGTAFKDNDDYTNYKYNQYLKETNKSLDYGQDILKQYGYTLDEVANTDLSGVVEGMDSVGDSTEKAKSKLEEFRDGLKDSIAQAMHGIFDEVKEQEYIDPEEMLYRMSENIRRVGEWARNISILAARGMSEGLLNELKNMGPEGAAKVKAFVEMTDEQLQMANRRWKAAEFMPDYGTKEIEAAYRDAGFNASLGFANGIDPNAANDAMLNLSDTALGTLTSKDGLWEESPSHKTQEMGEFAAQGLAIGMTDTKSQAVIRQHSHVLAALLLNTTKNELRPDIFKSLGINVTTGLLSGIENKFPELLSKLTSLISKIPNLFARILAIKSPSRVMAELGEYTMEGFGVGMEDGSSDLEKISEQTANDILNQMKANIAAITNGWSEDNAYQPVIRPVFDMEALNTGYNDIQSWFANSEGLNLNGNLSRLTPTNTDDSTSNQQIVDAINRINNDDVVGEIGALRDDISQLQTAITNMQVVLNTGVLVGQLVEPMDRALGSKALLNSRGRY